MRQHLQRSIAELLAPIFHFAFVASFFVRKYRAKPSACTAHGQHAHRYCDVTRRELNVCTLPSSRKAAGQPCAVVVHRTREILWWQRVDINKFRVSALYTRTESSTSRIPPLLALRSVQGTATENDNMIILTFFYLR